MPWTNLMPWGLKPPRSLNCGPGPNIRPGTGSKLASPARLEEPAGPSQEKLKMPEPGASCALGPGKANASAHGTTASEDLSRLQPGLLRVAALAVELQMKEKAPLGNMRGLV